MGEWEVSEQISSPLTPADRLIDAVLPGGWRVIARAEVSGRGPHSSVCWHVERDGERAFLKAVDLRRAIRSDPERPMAAVEKISRAYNYELELLEACAGRGMDRVVRALDHGVHMVDPGDELSSVFFLIFEVADGDLRQIAGQRELAICERLAALHDVAVGISQLHGAEIAHQDVKPANLLLYSEEQAQVRLGDPARASRPGGAMPHDTFVIAGARSHAPPEGLYGDSPPDWPGRRACDLYHLGSILLFLFAGVTATSAWVSRLDRDLVPRRLGGPYEGSYADALPFVRAAIAEVGEDFPDLGDPRLTEEIVRSFRELCDPEPALRGHPATRGGHRDRLSVERYIALFDREEKRALWRQKAA
jgi:eukaryotic-like serine/threonine-protein kinase